METSADLLNRTGEALSKIGQKTPSQTGQPETDEKPQQDELASLFDQPYIDPLTEYLQRHDGDPEQADQLAQVRRERDRRCRVIAGQYRDEPLTEAALQRYRAGYSFSCPAQVADYEAALEERQAQAQAASAPEESLSGSTPPSPTPTEASAPAQASPNPEVREQLSECYLLTTIRNFREALQACQVPAEAGHVQAQTNMAVISHALADYPRALRWASEAAPESGEAAFLLAEMYSSGRGVEPDPETANKWYHQAAGQGHPGAIAALQQGAGTTREATNP